MTLYHRQRSVKSDLAIPKKWNRLKLRIIYKKDSDFGEVSVCQNLKFREFFYLVNFSKNYLVSSNFI